MIAERHTTARQGGVPADDRVFGLKLGRFGLFATVIFSWALGLMSFCIACFVSILGILIWNATGHRPIDFANSYKYVALPVGSVVMVVSLVVLLAVWARRKARNI